MGTANDRARLTIAGMARSHREQTSHQEPAMRAMTPSVTSLMSPVFLDLTIENESGGVIAGNMGSLQAAHERRAVVRSSPAA